MRRWGLAALGWVLLLVGIVLFPLPGPGLLVMVAGLAILAEQFEWAERRVDDLKHRALESARRGVATHPRAWTSIAVTSALAASGLLWLWDPARPAWWVLPAWTWLPGGFWAGVSQLISGMLTLGLVVITYVSRQVAPRRERRRAEPPQPRG